MKGKKEKVIEVYSTGKVTQKVLSERFGVTERTINRWISEGKRNVRFDAHSEDVGV